VRGRFLSEDPNLESIEALPDSEDLGFAEPGKSIPASDTDATFTSDDDRFYSEPVYLDEEERANFETLVTFGKKSKQAQVWGHTILISTLTVEEELGIGLLVKPYMNSDAYTRAYKTAVVAASIHEIDGQPVYMPLSAKEDNNAILRKKWEKIKSYYPAVVDQMYRATTELEQELFSLLDKLAKKTSG
jgi:hypothetical protein